VELIPLPALPNKVCELDEPSEATEVFGPIDNRGDGVVPDVAEVDEPSWGDAVPSISFT
jgi:hypothetical protein